MAMLLMAAGVASVSLPGPDAGSLMPIFAVIGIGGGLTVPLTSSVLEAMPREKAAVATGIFNASREVSRLLGINVIGTVLRSAAGPAVRRSVARGRLPGWIPSRPVAGAAFGALGGAAGYFGLQRRTVGRHARACQQQGRSRSQNGQWTQRLRFWVPDFGAE